MNKNTYIRFIVAIATVFIILGGTSQGIFAGSISKNDASIVSASEDTGIKNFISNTDNDLDSEGHDKDVVAQQRNQLIANGYAFMDINLPNNGTWGYEQTFARTELFSEFNKARMNSQNWNYISGNDGSTTEVSITNVYVYDTELEKAAMQRAS